MDTIDILQKARDFLAGPGQWVPFTRDNSCGASCAMGGLARAIGKKASQSVAEKEDCHPAVLALAAVIPPSVRDKAMAKYSNAGYRLNVNAKVPLITFYNNTTDQKTVVAWFDRAIENLREHPMEKL